MLYYHSSSQPLVLFMWTHYKLMRNSFRYLDTPQPASGCRSSPCTDCEDSQMRCGCTQPCRRLLGPPHQLRLCAARGPLRASSGRFQLRSSYESPSGRGRGGWGVKGNKEYRIIFRSPWTTLCIPTVLDNLVSLPQGLRERDSVCVLPECGKKLGSSAGAARRSSWPAPPAGPALYQDISASTPSRYESPGGKMRGHKQLKCNRRDTRARDSHHVQFLQTRFHLCKRKEFLTASKTKYFICFQTFFKLHVSDICTAFLGLWLGQCNTLILFYFSHSVAGLLLCSGSLSRLGQALGLRQMDVTPEYFAMQTSFWSTPGPVAAQIITPPPRVIVGMQLVWTAVHCDQTLVLSVWRTSFQKFWGLLTHNFANLSCSVLFRIPGKTEELC